MLTDVFVLPQLLSEAAQAEPDRQAIVCGEDSMSYAELAEAAARFAGHLLARGLQSGDRVVVHAQKWIETVVAIHGTQWAGGVVVPLDAAAPADAAKAVLADAEPFAIVVDRRTQAISESMGIEARIGLGFDGVDGVTSFDQVLEAAPARRSDVVGDDPAYILFTSGSTGRPKGIVHSHRSGLRYAQLAASTFDLGPDDRLANIAPFHFDQSTFELYAAVAARATTVLVPATLLSFPAEVSALLERERITVWYSVPTLLVQLLERGALDQHDLSSLRWVLFGGEVFASEPLAELMRVMSNARFSNIYGPTEVNHCTHHHLDGPPEPGEGIPIGMPWGDTQVRLVDDDGKSIEGPGRGTLDVRTSTMMLGYWKRPDLTAAAIDADVDAFGLPRRWYRTGDLVDRDDAGRLTFLGRIDRQVKVRGHRIELEGVEAALGDAPGVVSCAVVVDLSADVPDLVGVIEGEDIDEAAVLRHLRSVLPAAAVPRMLRVVETLPRTHSGKIDARTVQSMIANQEPTT